MNRYDVETLAQYNAERARGLVHNDEWIRSMAALQKEFNADARRQFDDTVVLHRVRLATVQRLPRWRRWMGWRS